MARRPNRIRIPFLGPPAPPYPLLQTAIAPAYGLGRAERVVGEALRRLPEPDRPLVFTKCGLV